MNAKRQPTSLLGMAEAGMSLEPPRVVELTEDLAEHIEAVAKAARVFKASRLRPRAIELLLADATGLSRTNVRKVMDAAAELDTTYLKPKKKGGK